MRTVSAYKGFEIQVTIAHDGERLAGEYVIRPMRGVLAADASARFLAIYPPGFQRAAFAIEHALDDDAPQKLLAAARRAIDVTLAE